MRLLIVTHYFPEHRGGIEIIAGHLARRLERKGIQIAWAASDVNAATGAPGAVPMRTWNVTEQRLGFPYPLWASSSLSRLRKLVDWCDVVHLHDCLYFGNALACRLARRMGKPVVVTQHIGSVPYRNPILRLLMHVGNRTVARRVLTTADRCVFYSTRVRDFFANFVQFRFPPLYLPNGVDVGLYQPASLSEQHAIRQRLGWPIDRPVLLFVGRFVEKKGLPALREAARQLPECEFVFAGWGPIDPQSWGLANVHCTGSLSSAELVPLYQSADLLVLPSVGEGFPLVIQEAAACGTPALISRETAEGHEDVLTFTAVSDPDGASVTTKLREILNQPEELLKRRDLAARHAHQFWNWDEVAEKYRKIFEEVSRSKPSDNQE
ncbi:MAG: glycosyltransferase family 4 protein [Planctomycetes bacterium]|nr:glycosyltransferase family 4 protein [Planctomycetota bacterium]